jgi:hypothetical protein
MRFSNTVTPTGGAYGTAVGAYSGTDGLMPEKIFGVFRNSNTKTATITAASFVRGGPVILATGSLNGFDVVQPTTAGQPVNELFIGVVADYPDTTIGKTGVWQPEDFGIIQTYGIADAVVQNATVTQAAALLLTPTTGSALVTIGAMVVPTGTGSADTGTTRTGIAGLAVLMQTLASSSAAGTTSAKVFLRCM